MERELGRLRRAGERRRAADAADADLGYQAAVVAAAGLPRVANEFERLTWQVRMFLGALDIDLLETLPRVVAEVEALHGAIVARDVGAAERLWREKFERWIRDLVGRLGGGLRRRAVDRAHPRRVAVSGAWRPAGRHRRAARHRLGVRRWSCGDEDRLAPVCPALLGRSTPAEGPIVFSRNPDGCLVSW